MCVHKLFPLKGPPDCVPLSSFMGVYYGYSSAQSLYFPKKSMISLAISLPELRKGNKDKGCKEGYFNDRQLKREAIASRKSDYASLQGRFNTYKQIKPQDPTSYIPIDSLVFYCNCELNGALENSKIHDISLVDWTGEEKFVGDGGLSIDANGKKVLSVSLKLGKAYSFPFSQQASETIQLVHTF